MTDSSAFSLLDERIQHFLWRENWTELRDAQEWAIPPILGAHDVIVAAATASGKTEAAFLPALTRILQTSEPQLIVYISPLKALINDQFGRLERLCEELDIPVWPWHGDISSSAKARFLKAPSGVLLITPESLEALLCTRGTSITAIFHEAAYMVIDELHAFIGTERGKQLQSLLHRIEQVIAKRIPRIGLSATLGDMRLAAEFLRPGQPDQVRIIESRSGSAELKILVKGFEVPIALMSPSEGDELSQETAGHVAAHLFKVLRGSNNLVFPNSRREVERYTHLLNRLCESAQVPNEFWPHHGNLSKEIRAETEAALKQKELPATAICTNTLELGIDIGAVKSVVQIGPAPSVASLRQRLGRSGRRKGEPAILRGYSIENALGSESSVVDRLRLGHVQTVAMISLLMEGWFEPPVINGAHLSTLVQQLLSYVAQNGGATAAQAYQLLCGPGAPFANVSKAAFAQLLRHLGQKELLVQDSSGLLLHGRVGEKFVNHYSFYAAFASDEEFRIVSAGKSLGTLPVSQMLIAGQRILFAGKTWVVDEVSDQDKTIYVTRAKGGVPPLFSGGGGRTHTRVRQRMRDLLQSHEQFPFLDDTAQRFLEEAREAFSRYELASTITLDMGSQLLLVTWLGDAANEAISCFLIRRGWVASTTSIGVEISKGLQDKEAILDALTDAAMDDLPPLELLLADVRNLQREKWDWALPDELLRLTYASLYLDLREAHNWIRTNFGQ